MFGLVVSSTIQTHTTQENSIMARKTLIERAIAQIEENAAVYSGDVKPFLDPQVSSDYVKLKLSKEKNEVFMVMYLNNQHELIKTVKEFRGTIDGCSVHPRVIVQRALELNAAAVIFAHNHPSGVLDPSQSDIRITDRLKTALNLVEVRVLDHLILGRENGRYVTASFAERGML